MLSPRYIPALLGDAELLRQWNREADGGRLLALSVRFAPEQAETHYALGLSWVRQQRLDAALAALARATEPAPQNSQYRYAYAAALDASGDRHGAIRALEATMARFEGDPRLAQALLKYYLAEGMMTKATLLRQSMKVEQAAH